MKDSTVKPLYHIGTTVRFEDRDDRFEGQIVGVLLEKGRTTYKISWWSGRERKTEWFETFEFTVDGKPRLSVGFNGSEISNG